MATRVDLPPLPPFDPLSDPSSLSQRWKTWTKRFQMYLVATNITNDKQKRAMLLYQAGPATQEIFETLPDTGEDFDTALTKLNDYFAPKKNVDYEIFQFRQAVQAPGETVEQFATRLRKVAANCEFHDVNAEIKSAIIQHCHSKRLRRYALREETLTLDNLIAKARSLEISETQASGIEEKLAQGKSDKEEVNVIKGKPRKLHKTKPPTKPSKDSLSDTCRKCGLAWPHKGNPCPAKGQTCKKCGKPNHFARMCLTPTSQHKLQQSSNSQKTKLRQVTTVQEDCTSSSDDEYLYTLGKDKSKIPLVTVKINNVDVEMVIDTGASTDIIDEVAFEKINRNQNITLRPTTKRLFAYGSDEQLPVLGELIGDLTFKDNRQSVPLHVMKGKHGSLLSYKSAMALGILNIHVNKVVAESSQLDMLTRKFPSLFGGIGQLKDVSVKLHIDTSVQPVAQQPRRIPFHIRQKVESEIRNLAQKGIIEKVDGPTPWVSPLVVIPKQNGDIRICVDMRLANRAISRERHPMPTVDDLIHRLNGATVFSKLDLRSGYHQLTLAKESRYITTFATHKGLWRYTRLNFGTNSASEIFQKTIQDQLRDIPGSINISDDVIIFGKTQAEHDAALEAVCQKFASVNLTLNRKKCEFNKSSVTFFGFVFSSKGIAPDPKKVAAIKEAPAPTNTSGVRSFLGMATYCAKFIPKFSDVSEPLRQLTKKDQQFQWSAEHEHSFTQIKEFLTSAQVMAYFDPKKETELVTDASPTGLSAILMQNVPNSDEKRVVAYVSRTLTPVERRYSQTEREALAIVWAIEKLHLYLYGCHFRLITDCKPVQLIFSNPKSKPPARIERWNLRLQGYDFEVIHTAGNQNPSDYLSRHSNLEDESEKSGMAEHYVRFLSINAVPKAMTLDEIQQATAKDKTLQCVIHLMRNGWKKMNSLPEEHKEADLSELELFKRVQHELTVNDQSNIVLHKSRIVVPVELRERAVSLAHEGHQGIVKTKKLIREKVWFPNIDNFVKEAIDKCIACQANSPENKPDPLQMSPLPPAPWHTLHMDFCGPFPTGEYLFVVIDAYSRFPEVDIVHSTSASAIIPKLDRMFSTHGIPTVIRSDNGPPFTSHEIDQFMKENGIQLRRITPLWPQANSEAENFMKPLTKAIRSAHAEGKRWTKHLYRFLLNYRTTPHSTTGFPPAQLLFNRKVNNKLPQVSSTENTKLIEKDMKAKSKMKEKADKTRKAKSSTIKVGDAVLVKQRKQNKFSTRFNPNPFRVVKKNGTMITAHRNDMSITRNASHFKQVDPSLFHDQSEEEEDDEDVNSKDTNPVEDDPPPIRRSSRVRRPPERFGT